VTLGVVQRPRLRLRLAAHYIASGGIVAYPTEAVYGLGCDPWNAAAVRRLLRIKRRPEHKGLILIAAEPAQLGPFVEWLDPGRTVVVLGTWPGPVTWLLPANSRTPRWLTGDHDTLAVRVTAHPLAADLCRSAGRALVSTSANLSRHPPARTALQVRQRIGSGIDYILVGACGGRAGPSTIRDGKTGAVIRA
jgi:L-threonylcarbamoyladenylate synthase